MQDGDALSLIRLFIKEHRKGQNIGFGLLPLISRGKMLTHQVSSQLDKHGA
jgi:hypothetical protein